MGLSIPNLWVRTEDGTVRLSKESAAAPTVSQNIIYTSDTEDLGINYSVSVDLLSITSTTSSTLTFGTVLDLIPRDFSNNEQTIARVSRLNNEIKVVLYKRSTSNVFSELDSVIVEPPDSEANNFKISVFNNKYKVFYNNNLVIDYADSSFTGLPGGSTNKSIIARGFINTNHVGQIEIDNLVINELFEDIIESEIPQACSLLTFGRDINPGVSIPENDIITNNPLYDGQRVFANQFSDYLSYVANKSANNNNAIFPATINLQSFVRRNRGNFRICPLVGFQIQKLPQGETEWVDLDEDRTLLSTDVRNSYNSDDTYIPVDFSFNLQENDGLIQIRVRTIHGRDPTNAGDTFSAQDIDFTGENVDYAFSEWVSLDDPDDLFQVLVPPPPPSQTPTQTNTSTPTLTSTQTQTPTETATQTPTPTFSPTPDLLPNPDQNLILIGDRTRLSYTDEKGNRILQKNGLFSRTTTESLTGVVPEWHVNNVVLPNGSTSAITFKSNNSSWAVIEQYANNAGPDKFRFQVVATPASSGQFKLGITIALAPPEDVDLQEWVRETTLGIRSNIYQTYINVSDESNDYIDIVDAETRDKIISERNSGILTTQLSARAVVAKEYVFTVFSEVLLRDSEYVFILHGEPNQDENSNSLTVRSFVAEGLQPLTTPRETPTQTSSPTYTPTRTTSQTPTYSQTFANLTSLFNNHEVGIKNSKFYARGSNSLGELGLGDTHSRSVPEVFGLSGWRKVIINPYWTPSLSNQIPNVWYAIKANYSLWEWRETPSNNFDDTNYNNNYTGLKFIDNNVRDQAFANLTDLYYVNANNYRLYRYNIVNNAEAQITTDYTVSNLATITNKNPNITDKEIPLVAILYDGPTEFEIDDNETDLSLLKLNKDDFDQIYANYYGSCIFRSSENYFFGFGDNTYGQLGVGFEKSYIDFPEFVPHPDLKTWKSASIGKTHSLGIDEDGKLFAWGRNNKFQLGLTAEINDNFIIPFRCDQPILFNNTWKKVFCGENFSIAITTNNECYGWGANDGSNLTFGQLGRVERIPKRIYGTWDDISIYKNSILAVGLPPSSTPTGTTTPTPTNTQTSTPNKTPTPTHTPTHSVTTTNTSTPTVTPTNTSTPTVTVTNTGTPTQTITNTQTQSHTPPLTQTPTQTQTITKTQTATPTNTSSVTPTISPTVTHTSTQTPTNTVTQTNTQTGPLVLNQRYISDDARDIYDRSADFVNVFDIEVLINAEDPESCINRLMALNIGKLTVGNSYSYTMGAYSVEEIDKFTFGIAGSSGTFTARDTSKNLNFTVQYSGSRLFYVVVFVLTDQNTGVSQEKHIVVKCDPLPTPTPTSTNTPTVSYTPSNTPTYTNTTTNTPTMSITPTNNS